MKKAYIYIAIIITSILFSFYSNSQGSSVYVASIEDDIINPIMAEYIDHAVKEAEVNNAECLIIKLDTPGGLLTSTRK
ncbi:MAG: serine protease, partial [Deltaproteobacteria bacterium CG07_land_8_20_14_0_80_38_7]